MAGTAENTRRYSRKRMDLTGQRFGKLLVLRPADNVGNRTAWRCRCDCGREMVVKTCRLRDGRTTSCGCAGGGALERLTYVDGTCVEMLRAKTVRRNNTSGVPGVDWCASSQAWRATIGFKGRRHYLGKFPLFEDAVLARRQAERALHDSFLAEFDQRQGDQADTAGK